MFAEKVERSYKVDVDEYERKGKLTKLQTSQHEVPPHKTTFLSLKHLPQMNWIITINSQ
jgi:hypothetical protein